MSVVIAIKDGDRFVIGADKQGTLGGNRSHTAQKVWKLKNFPECVMGGVGLARASQVIQFTEFGFSRDSSGAMSDVDLEFMSTLFAPELVLKLNEAGIVTKITDGDEGSGNTMVSLPNAFIFASRDKGYMIGNDLTVEEIDDFIAIGSGADIARGSLLATIDENPFERIVKAITAAADGTTTVDDYIDILTTKDKEEDDELFNAAINGDPMERMAEALETLLDTMSIDELIDVLNGFKQQDIQKEQNEANKSDVGNDDIHGEVE